VLNHLDCFQKFISICDRQEGAPEIAYSAGDNTYRIARRLKKMAQGSLKSFEKYIEWRTKRKTNVCLTFPLAAKQDGVKFARTR
jgi:hypothetical protein